MSQLQCGYVDTRMSKYNYIFSKLFCPSWYSRSILVIPTTLWLHKCF